MLKLLLFPNIWMCFFFSREAAQQYLMDSRARDNGGQEARKAEICSAASPLRRSDTKLHRRQQEDQLILKRSAAQKTKCKKMDKICVKCINRREYVKER